MHWLVRLNQKDKLLTLERWFRMEEEQVKGLIHNLLSSMEWNVFKGQKKSDIKEQERKGKVRTPLANEYARNYYHKDNIPHEFLLKILDYVIENYAIPKNTALWKQEEGRSKKVGRHDRRMNRIIPSIKDEYYKDIARNPAAACEKHIRFLIRKHFPNKKNYPSEKSIKKYAETLYKTDFKSFR